MEVRSGAGGSVCSTGAMLSTDGRDGAGDVLGDITRREDDQFGGDGKAQGETPVENRPLLGSGNSVRTLPSVHIRNRLVDVSSHGPDAAEQCKERGRLLHEHACVENLHNKQAEICADVVQLFCTLPRVTDPVNLRLKALRLSAKPKLTIRGMADELGIGYSRYSYFEDPKRYKKSELPLDLTRQIAAVLARYGVDPTTVLSLAGLSGEEAQPDVREIKAAKPKLQFFTAQVLLPSEGALAAMLEPLLALIPPEASRAEAARILAQRLPAGFAAIGPGVIEVDSDEEPAGAALPPIPATEHHEQSRR